MTADRGLLSALRRVADLLRSRGVDFAVVEALAVGARTLPRFTSDVDLAVSARSDEEVETIVGHLLHHGYEISELLQHETEDTISTVRMTYRDNPDLFTDLLFDTSGIEADVVSAAELLAAFDDTLIPVAKIGHLIAMKLLSRGEDRPNDQAGLVQLAKAATAADFQDAEEAVRRIEERKKPDDRELLDDLRELRTRFHASE